VKAGQVLLIELRKGLTDVPATIANVEIDVYFYLNQKQRYGFRGGFTDAQGCLSVTYDYLEKRRRKSSEYQPWDYQTSLDDCDPLVRVVIPSMAELVSAHETYKRFNAGVVSPEAAAWLSAANDAVRALPVVAQIVGEEARVVIPVEEPGQAPP
jgi:hypothetical protein